MGLDFNSDDNVGELNSFIEGAFRAHAKDVNKWLLYKGCNRSMAEELVQDAFIKLYENYDRLDNAKSVKSWLISTAYNAYVNYLTKASTRYEEVGETYDDALNNYLDDASSLATETMDCVEKQLLEFQRTDPERALVINMQLDDAPISEIALLIGRAEGATRTFIYEAKKKLKPLLEQCREFISHA